MVNSQNVFYKSTHTRTELRGTFRISWTSQESLHFLSQFWSILISNPNLNPIFNQIISPRSEYCLISFLAFWLLLTNSTSKSKRNIRVSLHSFQLTDLAQVYGGIRMISTISTENKNPISLCLKYFIYCFFFRQVVSGCLVCLRKQTLRKIVYVSFPALELGHSFVYRLFARLISQ